jgi:hypothetical protein
MELSHQASDAMQLYTNDINQIRNSHPYFSFFLSIQKIRISAKSAMIRAGRPDRITALEGYAD